MWWEGVPRGKDVVEEERVPQVLLHVPGVQASSRQGRCHTNLNDTKLYLLKNNNKFKNIRHASPSVSQDGQMYKIYTSIEA